MVVNHMETFMKVVLGEKTYNKQKMLSQPTTSTFQNCMCLNFHQAIIETIFHCIHNKVVQNQK
jgi:hypothetical protein